MLLLSLRNGCFSYHGPTSIYAWTWCTFATLWSNLFTHMPNHLIRAYSWILLIFPMMPWWRVNRKLNTLDKHHTPFRYYMCCAKLLKGKPLRHQLFYPSIFFNNDLLLGADLIIGFPYYRLIIIWVKIIWITSNNPDVTQAIFFGNKNMDTDILICYNADWRSSHW